MTRGFARHHTLLAPQDGRSAVWQIAKDCTSALDARELAAKLIPESHDRIWSDAARAVLTACLIKLQTELPSEWGWAELRGAATQSAEQLRETAANYYPEALHVLGEEASKTTQSVLTTLQSHLHTVSALAEAWKTSSVNGLSLSQWLNNPYQTPPLILQYDGRYPDLSNAWISAFVATLSSIIASPAFEEDPNRRIWLFLDEFPQLNRLAHFSTLLDTGRSKGVCVVLGLQDIAQLRDRYGRDQADAWISMIGTHIITRITLGRSAEDVCRLISTQTFEIYNRNKTYSKGDVSVNEGKRVETQLVLTVADLQSRLGPKKHGIRALMLGPGKDVYEFDVPYITLPTYRPASQHKDSKPVVSKPPTAAKVASLLSAEAVRKIRMRSEN
jgi:type IV secretory pathway TraG/TraD family ATPase VirD4